MVKSPKLISSPPDRVFGRVMSSVVDTGEVSLTHISFVETTGR